MSTLQRHWQRLDAFLQRIGDRLFTHVPWLLPRLVSFRSRVEDGAARSVRWASALRGVRTATVVPAVIVLLSASAIALAVVGVPTQPDTRLDGLAAGWDGQTAPEADGGSSAPTDDDVTADAGGSSDITAEHTGPDPDPDRDMETTTGDDPAAVLHVVAGGVDVVRGGTTVAASGGERLGPGDAVVTGPAGVAELSYPDGSLTRIGTGSRMELEALATNPSRVRVALDVGSTWHRVRDLTRSGGSFEVETETGVAAVRGTAFAVLCTPGRCGVAVAEGRVDVRAAAAEGAAVLRPGDTVRVAREQLGEIEPPSGELAAAITDNVVRDRAAGLPAPDPSRRGAEDTGRPDEAGAPDREGGSDDAGETGGAVKPDVPRNPDLPREPDAPGKPDVPREPDAPGKPDVPREPDAPGKPADAGEPDAPGKPAGTGEPDAPGKPDVPREPEAPGKPDDADNAESPTKPEGAPDHDRSAEPDPPGKPQTDGDGTADDVGKPGDPSPRPDRGGSARPNGTSGSGPSIAASRGPAADPHARAR